MATKKGKATVVEEPGRQRVHEGYIPGEHVILPALKRASGGGNGFIAGEHVVVPALTKADRNGAPKVKDVFKSKM
ncbi:MAG: hypothetical protein HQ472_06005 [Ignavibacteria bacterium]|nr:hypothetical protein [Ignavibacteria bacterium]